MGGALIIALFLTPAGLIALYTGFSDWMEQKAFLKKATETEGTITGLVGAKFSYKKIGGGIATPHVTAIQMATGNNMEKETSTAGGAFLRVEYEVGDYVYTTRSRQNFNTIPENGQVKVQYNPQKPQEAIVEGFYSGPEKVFQMVGGFAMASLPIIYQLFFG